MSIDIWLEIDTGIEMITAVDVGNYTHNCQPMWSYALRETNAEIDQLCAFNNITAMRAFPMLQAAVAHMDDPTNRAFYEALQPDNGWGDFVSAREYLRQFMAACRDHPKCIIGTSC